MQEPISPSGEQVELSSGDQRAVVVGVGGGLRVYAAGDRPVLDGYSVVNDLGENDEDRVPAAYGANYQRLAALKKKYDPDNFFRLNPNIKPAN